MQPGDPITAAGETDPGLKRQVNEDRFLVDVSRGIFAVIDGVGGQAAGGKAADIALSMLRTRLERETGPVSDRIRESIAIANNEIHRLAATRPEWNGMACVLTVALVKEGLAIIGHVGDTRLYKLRNGRSRKLRGIIRRSASVRMRTSSPKQKRCGTRGATRCIAMSGPSRTSQPIRSSSTFNSVPFEADAALLLCSDGLTDLVPSGEIQQIASRLPEILRRSCGRSSPPPMRPGARTTSPQCSSKGNSSHGRRRRRDNRRATDPRRQPGPAPHGHRPRGGAQRAVSPRAMVRQADPQVPRCCTRHCPPDAESRPAGRVDQAAIARARPGFQVIVEPGEYREQLRLKDRVAWSAGCRAARPFGCRQLRPKGSRRS